MFLENFCVCGSLLNVILRNEKKISKLQRFGSGDRNDMLLKELWEMSDILTKPPIDPKSGKKLKKSKSMIKQSKSMIMSAKDIPMNAFLAIKTTSDEKDETWLKNFLSESVVDDIPWECSKALIIMKDGFQAIIPREASRSILLGEASYTLIDDNGIEFFLSPMDKRKRRLEGKDEDPTSRIQKESNDPMPSFNKPKRAAPLQSAIIEEEEEEDELPKSTMKPIKKDQPLMDDADLSLFTKKKPIDSDDEDFGFERPKFGKKFESSFANQTEDDLADMEKYRPHNFETTRPKGDDINDLMDYYSNYKTNRNAMGRISNINRQVRNYDDEFDDVPVNDGFEKEMNWRKKYSDPEQNYTPDYDPVPPRKKFSEPDDIGIERSYGRTKFDYSDTIDPATRLILMKNNQSSPSRTRRAYDDTEPQNMGYRPPQRQTYNSNFDDGLDMMRPSPPKQRESGGDNSALSSHTRMMLDKLKQSTQELQGLTDETEDITFTAAKKADIRRKKSRFLRNMSAEDNVIDEESERYASSLANDVLGLRNDSMGEFDKYRPEPFRQSPPKRPGKSRNFDYDDEPAVPTYKFVDEDDTDAMIQNLKQKTTRRAATDILRDIEKDVTPVKFEPVTSFRDTFRPSPEPENNRYGSLNRKSNKQTRKPAAFDTTQDIQNPFTSLRKQEPQKESPYARFAPKTPASYNDEDEGMMYGGGKGGSGGGYGGTQNYGSL